MTTTTYTRDDVKMCTCAQCGAECISFGERYVAESHGITDLPVLIGGRIGDRPYCVHCVAVRRPPQRTDPSWQGNDSPWQQNAIRDMEDGGGT